MKSLLRNGRASGQSIFRMFWLLDMYDLNCCKSLLRHLKIIVIGTEAAAAAPARFNILVISFPDFQGKRNKGKIKSGRGRVDHHGHLWISLYVIQYYFHKTDDPSKSHTHCIRISRRTTTFYSQNCLLSTLRPW
jgi:hypothetical protein